MTWVSPPMLKQGETLLGRSRRSDLFHIADPFFARGLDGLFRVRWMCGAVVTTERLAPDYVKLPTDNQFGGVDHGRVCAKCHARHNAKAMAQQDRKLVVRRRRRRR